jgi:hypothetical protein
MSIYKLSRVGHEQTLTIQLPLSTSAATLHCEGRRERFTIHIVMRKEIHQPVTLPDVVILEVHQTEGEGRELIGACIIGGIQDKHTSCAAERPSTIRWL